MCSILVENWTRLSSRKVELQKVELDFFIYGNKLISTINGELICSADNCFRWVQGWIFCIDYTTIFYSHLHDHHIEIDIKTVAWMALICAISCSLLTTEKQLRKGRAGHSSQGQTKLGFVAHAHTTDHCNNKKSSIY